LAYGLAELPGWARRLAVEKRRDWSDCGGEVESCHSKDDLLTSVMIYWVTQTIGTSVRYYYEGAANPWKPSHGGLPVVDTPTASSVSTTTSAISRARSWSGITTSGAGTRVAAGGHRPDGAAEILSAALTRPSSGLCGAGPVGSVGWVERSETLNEINHQDGVNRFCFAASIWRLPTDCW